MGPLESTDPGLHNVLASVAGGTHPHLVQGALSWPVTIIGAVVLLLVLSELARTFLGTRGSSSVNDNAHDWHDAGYGAQCPHCSSFATQQSGRSFERRQCSVCGHTFTLKE